MKIKSTHRCRCGHTAAAHTSGVFPIRDPEDNGVDLEVIWNNAHHTKLPGCCGRCIDLGDVCEKFQLPNLDLIEYLAEKRGLI